MRADENRPSLPAAIGTECAPVHLWLFAVAVAFATFLAFSPALRNQFLLWDDNFVLTGNQNYRGLGWAQLRWMFTTFYQSHYQPLTWISFAVDYLLWGMNPTGYHLTNIVLHAFNAALFFLISLRLLRLARRGSKTDLGLCLSAGFSALLFSLHPLRVESVAWATERKDVLSGLFYLGTILAYLRSCAGPEGASGRRWYMLSLLAYASSLLSKGIGVTLPVTLLILDVYPLRRLPGDPLLWFAPPQRPLLVEKLPYAALALAMGVIGYFGQSHEGYLMAWQAHGFSARIAQAAAGLTFYLWKTIFPLRLLPLYRLPSLTPASWEFAFRAALLLSMTAVFWKARRDWPAGLAAWTFYVATLLPVLGFVQFGSQLAADRYSYLSCMAWPLLAGGGMLSMWDRRVETARKLLFPAAGVVCFLAVLTWRQAQVWHDTKSLWSYAIDIDPELVQAHNNLGYALAQEGRWNEAIAQYRETLKIFPDYPYAHRNLADALAAQGKPGEAVEHYRRALQARPDSVDILNDLGLALARQGDFQAAAAQYREALRLQPQEPQIHNNLGLALARGNSLDEAADQFRAALNLKPDHADAHGNLGVTLMLQGRFDEGRRECREALRIDPRRLDPCEKVSAFLKRPIRR